MRQKWDSHARLRRWLAQASTRRRWRRRRQRQQQRQEAADADGGGGDGEDSEDRADDDDGFDGAANRDGDAAGADPPPSVLFLSGELDSVVPPRHTAVLNAELQRWYDSQYHNQEEGVDVNRGGEPESHNEHEGEQQAACRHRRHRPRLHRERVGATDMLQWLVLPGAGHDDAWMTSDRCTCTLDCCFASCWGQRM